MNAATATIAMDRRAGDRSSAAARRAIGRWAWRLFRRGWRQQLLVLVMLTVAGAAAIGFASAAYNIAPAQGRAEFGTASHFVRARDADEQMQAAMVRAAGEWFGTIDVIRHRGVTAPGDAEPVVYRAQDPAGPYGTPQLGLLDGRFPTSAAEVAVTDGVAERFGLEVGATFGLDGVERTVVGTVENPSDLGDEFALVSSLDPADSVTVLVDADDDRVTQFRAPGAAMLEFSSRDEVREDVMAAMGVLMIAVVALALVALVATASFVVVAQRRLRQLGMLGAIGATERQLRFVVMANGVAIGISAAVLGTAIGLAGWVALVPWVETAAGHRIDGSNVPWWVVIASAVLCVGATIAASWWPARTMARVTSVAALSGRPPKPARVRRSVGLAVALIVVGVGCLRSVGELADEVEVHWGDVLRVGAGTVATILGVLLLTPLAIRALASVAHALPIAPRLALRDLDRYQTRSSAALAAVSLTLGIAVAIVGTAAAAEHAASAGNLSDRQLLVRDADIDGPFVPPAAAIEQLQHGIAQIASVLDAPTVTSLEVAVDPAVEHVPGIDDRQAVSLGERAGDGWRDLTMIYVATPELLQAHRIERDGADLGTALLTTEPGELRILGVAIPATQDDRDPRSLTDRVQLTPGHTSLPGTFMSAEEIHRHGWQTAPSGRWLIETTHPLDDHDVEAMRDVAARNGLTVESRDRQERLASLRAIATAIGALLALTVLASTVGLIRAEAASDIRTFTATGATSATRRAVTSVTAGALAAMGGVLGTAGAYLAMSAGHVRHLADLSRVPYAHLAVIVVGVPIVAAAASWFAAGREPPVISRQAIE